MRVQFTSDGNAIDEIKKKSGEKNFMKCGYEDGRYLCEIKEKKRDEPYLYNVKLSGCDVWDPKIIITN